MDNITHSLTGILAARVADGRALPEHEVRTRRRTFFWLLLLSANLPDIDVVLGMFADPIVALQHHRGITHSLLFAPAFALLPALMFRRFGRVKDLRYLWLGALTGILLHIFFDLITPFGTQLLAPLSTERYSLDWMFIIDPLFTGVLGLTLLAGRILIRNRSLLARISMAFVVIYLGIEVISHRMAASRVEDYIARERLAAENSSVFPQPLSIFRWMGVIQTADGAAVSFFSVMSDDSLHFDSYRNSNDRYVAMALSTPEAQWYKTFARHPVVQSHGEDGRVVVELHDMQFTIDKGILKWFGVTDRPPPFVMRFEYDPNGRLLALTFNNNRVRGAEIGGTS